MCKRTSWMRHLAQARNPYSRRWLWIAGSLVSLAPRNDELSVSSPSPQIQLLEKIIALVVDDDEGRKILDFDAPDRFHAELGIFLHLDFLDAVLGQIRRRTADGGQIKSAVLLAGVAHLRRAVALGERDHR